jgi:hypothetical protein
VTTEPAPKTPLRTIEDPYTFNEMCVSTAVKELAVCYVRKVFMLELMFQRAQESLGSDPPPGKVVSFSCQVHLAKDVVSAGELLKTEIPGIYKLVSPARGPQGQPTNVLLEQYFAADDIVKIDMMRAAEPEQRSAIIYPG